MLFFCRSTRLTWLDGQTDIPYSIHILPDTEPEDWERLVIQLTDATGGVQINSSLTVHIPLNDNAHGLVHFAQVAANIEVKNLQTYFLLVATYTYSR